MSAIQFTQNYQDLSTDKGFQFKFHCDKCGNGFMSEYQTNALGMAEGLLSAAGSTPHAAGWEMAAPPSAFRLALDAPWPRR